MVKILVYDCEILRCIQQKGIMFNSMEPQKPFEPFGDGIQYADSWRDFKNLGISVISCYFKSRENDYWRSFVNFDNSIPWNCPEFKQLLVSQKPFVIGFNTKNFDDKLCRTNSIPVTTKYDLLEEIRYSAFGSKQHSLQPKGYSYTLGAIAKANGMAKTGSGEQAPRLWQQGKRQEVIDYCTNDVRITLALFELGRKGKLLDPNTGKFLKLRAISKV